MKTAFLMVSVPLWGRTVALKLFYSIYTSVLFPNSYKLATFFLCFLQVLHVLSREHGYETVPKEIIQG